MVAALLNGHPRPRYAQLSSRDDAPAGSSWGLWGAEDQIGALNLITPAHVERAAALVKRGAVFPLNWRLEHPDPALFQRGPIEHVKVDDGFGMDDHFNNFFPHGSSHWDSMGHFRHPRHGYYGGRTAEQLKGPAAQNSIAEWAKRGVAGRFVLADVATWRKSAGRPIDQESPDVITVDDVVATLTAQETEVEEGDILLLRAGWVGWYGRLGLDHRRRLAEEPWRTQAPGLSAEERTVAWLWDAGIVAVASDLPAVEPMPFDPESECLHARALALLGINLGEMFVLDPLADDCAQDGRYTGLLVSAPMNFTGATGSPANALALK
jgi:kynurenine formamidase